MLSHPPGTFTTHLGRGSVMTNHRILRYDRACKDCGTSPIYGYKRCESCAARNQTNGVSQGIKKDCTVCNQTFTAYKHRAKYCTRACEHIARKQRLAARLPERTCKNCGDTFSPSRLDCGDQYCSRECAHEDVSAYHYISSNVCYLPEYCLVDFGPCVECGTSMITLRNGMKRICCSNECRSKYGYRRTLKALGVDDTPCERSCEECGTVFRTYVGNKKRRFCSSKCGHKRWNRKGKDNKSRAILYGVEYERVHPFEIFDRDGWRCQICGVRTPKRLRGSYKDSAPELDHRIPMSKGGNHTPDNMQCSCRACNKEKSNNNSVGQYPLFETG